MTSINHIAFIPDGNRRFAKNAGLELAQGYVKGIEKIEEVADWSRENGIKHLSTWGLSTENFNRGKEELEVLMKIFKFKLSQALNEPRLHDNNVRVRFFGKRELLPNELQKQMTNLEKATLDYDNFYLNIFLGYGGRQEIVDATNSILQDFKAGKIKNIDEAQFSKYLYTHDLPDPELIVRTSGEERLSGFMSWQSAYSEFVFHPKLWPALTREDFSEILKEYESRQRRFGK